MDLITVSRASGSGFDIRVRGHSIRSDLAGGELGFNPAELFAGALGACVAMMVQDRCDRQEHTDGNVEVSLAMELADAPKRVASMFLDVELPGDVPEEDLERIRRIAHRCVIHETLADPPKVHIEIG